MLSTRTHIMAYLTSCKQCVRPSCPSTPLPPPNRLTVLSSLNIGRPCLPGHGDGPWPAPDCHSPIPSKAQQVPICSLRTWQRTWPGSILHLSVFAVDQHRDLVNSVNGNYTATDNVLFQSSSSLPQKEPDAPRVLWEQCAPCAAPQPPLPLQPSGGYWRLWDLGTYPSYQGKTLASGPTWQSPDGQQPSPNLN